jgi:hypothetical protein
MRDHDYAGVSDEAFCYTMSTESQPMLKRSLESPQTSTANSPKDVGVTPKLRRKRQNDGPCSIGSLLNHDDDEASPGDSSVNGPTMLYRRAGATMAQPGGESVWPNIGAYFNAFSAFGLENADPTVPIEPDDEDSWQSNISIAFRDAMMQEARIDVLLMRNRMIYSGTDENGKRIASRAAHKIKKVKRSKENSDGG